MKLTIESLAFGGFGLGSHEGRKIFVPFTIPGEEVVCRIVEDRKRFAWAEVVEVTRPSPQRKQPPCPYFGRCGGCQWQHIDDGAQAQWKERVFAETLLRLGRISGEPVLPLIPSPQMFSYRNRVTLHVRKGRIGFFATQSNRLVEIDRCLISASPINDTIASLIGQPALSDLETVEIAAGPFDQEVTLFAHAGRPLTPRRKEQLATLFTGIEKARAMVLEDPTGATTFPPGGETSSRFGIRFELDIGLPGPANLWFFPGVFTQVNWPQNERMVQLLLSRVQAIGDRLAILELHAGAGNFTIPLALKGHKVQPVEWSNPAVQNNRFNLQMNHLTGVRPLRQTAERALSDLVRKGDTFDLVVVDPPRGGLKKELDSLIALKPPNILYISCDPATLSRDIARFLGAGYRIDFIQPFDFFPQTYHVESMTLLRRA